MFYLKNVPGKERIVRILTGMAAFVFAAMNWGVSNFAVGAGIIGAMLAMTGLMGFCPVCAMAGRKTDKKP